MTSSCSGDMDRYVSYLRTGLGTFKRWSVMALRDKLHWRWKHTSELLHLLLCTEHISYFLWLDVNTVEHRLLMMDLERIAGGRFCAGKMKNARIPGNYLLQILICSVFIMPRLYVRVYRLAPPTIIFWTYPLNSAFFFGLALWKK